MARGDGQGINRAGGGYGGAGSRGDDGPANAGPPYARAHAPIYPGSGAGSYGNGAGRGGGAVRIGAHGAMTIDGTISAHGMTRSIIHAGGGSGGGILLSAKTVTGSGTLRANGGMSSNAGGAGGGGRICVWMPLVSPAVFRHLVNRDLPTQIGVLDYTALWPALTLSVAPGSGGTNPLEAQSGTVFFGRFHRGTVLSIR